MGVKGVFNFIKDHSGTILSGIAIAGVGATGYFSAEGALKSVDEVKPEMTRLEKVKAYGKCYWKAGVSFVLTSICIAGSDRVHVGKEATLAGLIAVNKDRVIEMKKKIADKYGSAEANDIYQEVIEEEAQRNKAGSKPKLRDGEILVYEPHTEQYIPTTIKKIEYALKRTNEQFEKVGKVKINYFNKLIGGKYDFVSGNDGWSKDDPEQNEEWSCMKKLFDEANEYYIPKIELVQRVYMHEVTGNVTPSNYLRNDEEVESGDIPVLFFTVNPRPIE